MNNHQTFLFLFVNSLAFFLVVPKILCNSDYRCARYPEGWRLLPARTCSLARARTGRKKVLTLTSSSSVTTRPNKQVWWRSLLHRFNNKNKNFRFCFVLCSFNRTSDYRRRYFRSTIKINSILFCIVFTYSYLCSVRGSSPACRWCVLRHARGKSGQHRTLHWWKCQLSVTAGVSRRKQ